MIEKAKKFFNEGKYEEALNLFQLAGGIEGDYGEAVCLYKMGKERQACDILERCLANNPSFEPAKNLLDKIYHKSDVASATVKITPKELSTSVLFSKEPAEEKLRSITPKKSKTVSIKEYLSIFMRADIKQFIKLLSIIIIPLITILYFFPKSDVEILREDAHDLLNSAKWGRLGSSYDSAIRHIGKGDYHYAKNNLRRARYHYKWAKSGFDECIPGAPRVAQVQQTGKDTGNDKKKGKYKERREELQLKTTKLEGEINPIVEDATKYYKLGQYDEAIAKYDEALNKIEKSIGKENSYYNEVKNKQYEAKVAKLNERMDFIRKEAAKYQEAGQYDEAMAQWDMVLVEIEELFGQESVFYKDAKGKKIGVKIVELEKEIASFDKATFDSQKAIDKYDTVLMEIEESIGQDNYYYKYVKDKQFEIKIADIKSKITVLKDEADKLKEEGQHNEALMKYEEALAAIDKSIGSENLFYDEILKCMDDLTYEIKEEKESRKRRLVKLSEIKEKVDPILEEALQYKTGYLYEEAEQAYTDALQIIEESLGKGDFYYGEVLSALATMYADIDMYGKAEQIYKSVLEERGSSQSTILLRNLAGLYIAWGEYKDAEPLLKKALDICKKDSTQIYEYESEKIITLNTLAALYVEIGNYEEGEKYLHEAMKIFESQRETLFITQEKQYIETLNHMGILYTKTGNYSKSEDYLKKALAIGKKYWREDPF